MLKKHAMILVAILSFCFIGAQQCPEQENKPGMMIIALTDDSPKGDIESGLLGEVMVRAVVRIKGENATLEGVGVKRLYTNECIDNMQIIWAGEALGEPQRVDDFEVISDFPEGTQSVDDREYELVMIADTRCVAEPLPDQTTFAFEITIYATGVDSGEVLDWKVESDKLTARVIAKPINVFINEDVKNGTQEMPTGTLGQRYMLGGSVVVQASQSENTQIPSFVIQDNIGNGFSLYDFFEEMSIVTGSCDAPLAFILTTEFVDQEYARYMLIPEDSLIMGSGSSRSYQFCYNVRSSVDTSMINFQKVDIILETVSARGLTTGEDLSWTTPINFQDIYLDTKRGAFSASFAESAEYTHDVVMGSYQTLAIDIESLADDTGWTEDGILQEIHIQDISADAGSITNMKIVGSNGITQHGRTITYWGDLALGVVTDSDRNWVCLDENASDSDDEYNEKVIILDQSYGVPEALVVEDYEGSGSECLHQTHVHLFDFDKLGAEYGVLGDAMFNKLDVGSVVNIPANMPTRIYFNFLIGSVPVAVSDATHRFRITKVVVVGKDSQEKITFFSGSQSAELKTYRSKLTLTPDRSIGGTSVASSRQEVYRFEMTADVAHDVAFYPPSFKVSGTAPFGSEPTLLQGTSSAMLYDRDDLTTAIAEIKYAKAVFRDLDGVDSGDENWFQVKGEATVCDGFQGVANVTWHDVSQNTYRNYVVAGTHKQPVIDGPDDCIIYLVDRNGNSPQIDFDDLDVLHFYPANQGAGVMAFGGFAYLQSDVQEGDSLISFASRPDGLNPTLGMQTGKDVYLSGYDEFGNPSNAVCNIKSVFESLIYVETCVFDPNGGQRIDVSYNSYYSQLHPRSAIGTTFTDWQLGNLDVSRGSTDRYSVFADTTGLTTEDTLRFDIEEYGVVWTDSINPGVFLKQSGKGSDFWY